MTGPVVTGPPVTATASLVRQAERLAADVADLVPALSAQLTTPFPGVRQVLLVGNGDSHHAGAAAEHAFTTFAGVRCRAVPAQRFADYPGTHRLDARTLVVGTSASGGSPRVAEALDRAAALGASTLAITGKPGSAVDERARHRLHAVPENLERGPGIRTHQASLLALLLLAIHTGRSRGVLGAAEARGLEDELTATAERIDRTLALVAPGCRAIAPVVASAPVRYLLGAGPGFGTAGYAAAKLVEAAGVPSSAQDFEEWWHVERFCRPTDLPVFLIATPGKAADRAAALAARATAAGRRIALVGATAPDVWAALPVADGVREELSPLVHSVFAPLLAAGVADHLGRQPFHGDLRTAERTTDSSPRRQQT
ncbi:glucosamine--fructose-6-phosphate aminotransferase (isomerizing) [Lentzea fradiae]|uniref:Glutamine--fructose-6-phosphate aminotransferase [isomerizing] n=1 Tax=Lentzea fradiae TaxID=200378 RepID=A0A1G7VJI9_9PSEU|nr:SIS domain-containing protein [Lentzea fradiae]SDG59569.1 glucosamine--fructose-6-phosphate aminotransferase (isomerizing) [Lentzea fradiae]